MGKKDKGLTDKEKAAKKLQEEKERAMREAAEAAERERRLAREKQMREYNMSKSAYILNSYDEFVLEQQSNDKQLREWSLFRACKNIPDFSQVHEVNSYISWWLGQLENPQMKTLLKLTPEYLKVIDELREFLLLPPDTCRLDTISELGILYHTLIRNQLSYMDKCSYKLIEDLSEFYDPEIGVFEYTLSVPELTHCLWANLYLTPYYTGHTFQDVHVAFKLPESLLEVYGIYRLIKMEYDHYSDSSQSYFAPAVNNALKRAIIEWVQLTRVPVKEFLELQERASASDRGDRLSVGSRRKGRGRKDRKRRSQEGGDSTENLEADEESKKGLSEVDTENETEGKDQGKKEQEPETSEAPTEEESEAQQPAVRKSKKKAGLESAVTRRERKRKRRLTEEIEEEDDFDFDFMANLGKMKQQDLDEAKLYEDDDDAETSRQLKKQQKKAPKEEEEEEEKETEGKKHEKPSEEEKAQEEDTSAPSEAKKGKPAKKEKGKKASQGSVEPQPFKKGGKAPKGEKKDEEPKKEKKGKGKEEKADKKGATKKEDAKSARGSAAAEKGKTDTEKEEKSKKRQSTISRQSKSSRKSQSKEGRKSRSKEKGTGAKEEKAEPAKPAKAKEEKEEKPEKGGKKAEKTEKEGKKAEKTEKEGKETEKPEKEGKKGKKGEKEEKPEKESKKKEKKDEKAEKKDKGKAASKSRSTSRGRSKERGDKKKGKGKEQKSEAELAKQRERAEKAKFIPEIGPDELNLRSYTILGGVYDFRLYEVPTQPVSRNIWTIHLKEPIGELKEIPFDSGFAPPTPPGDQSAKKSPEEMEREAKEQEEQLQKLVEFEADPTFMGGFDDDESDEMSEAARKASMEAEYQRRLGKLIQLEIDLPRSALWFEPPIPVRWNDEDLCWEIKDFYDLKYNENTMHLSIKTTAFGVFGFSHSRWCNLPYQTWEIKPLGKDKVSFTITAAIVVVELLIMGKQVCLNLLQNAVNSSQVEAALIGKYMDPETFKKKMKQHGLDLFPEIDSYAYVDGILVKNMEAENNLYQGMALASSSFNFQWSRWNLLAGRERIVFQMRERLGTTTPGNYSTVMGTTEKTIRITCTEVSPSFSEEPISEDEFFGDLISVVRATGTEQAMRNICQSDPYHIETMRNILCAIRPLSFS